jgi:hypothetical protein
MRVKSVIAALIVVAAVVGLSGCTVNLGQTAATVNGQVLSERTLRDTADAVAEVLAESTSSAGADPFSFTVQMLLLNLALPDVLEQAGAGLDDPTRQEIWNSLVSPEQPEYRLFTDERTRDVALGYIDMQWMLSLLQSGQLDGNALFVAISSLPFDINPRYGSFDVANLTLSSRVAPNSVAGPLAELTTFDVP